MKSDVESMCGIISMRTEKVHQVMLISTRNGRAPHFYPAFRYSPIGFNHPELIPELYERVTSQVPRQLLFYGSMFSHLIAKSLPSLTRGVSAIRTKSHILFYWLERQALSRALISPPLRYGRRDAPSDSAGKSVQELIWPRGNMPRLA